MTRLGDLSVEELELERCCSMQNGRMVAEIQRRRAEQAAGREHVERVVREEIEADLSNGEPASFDVIDAAYHISRRVADRLSAPVLSAEDVAHLTTERDGLATAARTASTTAEHMKAMLDRVALLDRILAGAKP